jgi:hypothetical protein
MVYVAISQVNTQTMHTKSITHNSIFPKILIPWRDSNPGLLFLRRMRCPLRHAARADSFIHNALA